MANLVIWSWVIPYFGLTGAFLAKFNRYMSPLLPFAALWGAWLIAVLWAANWRRSAPETAVTVSTPGVGMASLPEDSTASQVPGADGETAPLDSARSQSRRLKTRQRLSQTALSRPSLFHARLNRLLRRLARWYLSPGWLRSCWRSLALAVGSFGRRPM